MYLRIWCVPDTSNLAVVTLPCLVGWWLGNWFQSQYLALTWA